LRILNKVKIKKRIDQKCDVNYRIWINSTNEIVHPLSWNRKFRLIINIFIIKFFDVK